MSEANIKIIYREFEKNKELYALRYGKGEARKKDAYFSFTPPERKFTLLQGDGKVMAFHATDAEGNKAKYTLLYLIDVCSKMIVAYTVGTSENTELWLELFDNLLQQYGKWPAEYVTDRHAFTKTDNAAILFGEVENMGGKVEFSINPQAKSICERSNAFLDSIWKEYDSKGNGLLSRSKDARPSQEAQEEFLKPKNWKTPDEMKALALIAVTKYNNTPLESLARMTPKQKFDASEYGNFFNISDADRIRLLRRANIYKVMRGQITIKQGSKKHEFQLPEELQEKYNDCRVEVRHEDLKEGVYLFDIKTGKPICTLDPKTMFPAAVTDRTPEQQKAFNHLKGKKSYSIVKARKTASDRIAEGLMITPDDLELINSYARPKEVVTELELNRDLTRAAKIDGINPDRIPVRERTATVIKTPAKTKETPYTDCNHKITKGVPDDFYE